MFDRLSGLLRVADKVTLDTGTEILEVIVLPLQASIAWEMIVERSVQALRPFDGQHVTLEGQLRGNILDSARLVQDEALRKGTYRGRLEAASGVALHVDVRLDTETMIVSADFFSEGNYYCSMRGLLQDFDGMMIAGNPRFIFDNQNVSSVGGRIEIGTGCNDALHVNCVIPEAIPAEYTGEVSFESEYFRVLNIEVDKLEGLPWPPEYALADIPPENQPSDIAVQDISLAALFKQAGIDARVLHNDGGLGVLLGQAAGRPGEEDRWDERELHEMMDTNYSRSLSDREWWLYLLAVTRFDGGPEVDENGFIVTDQQGNIVNSGVGTTGIIFDHSTGNIRDPWSPFAEWFEANNPQFKHLFDFGRTGGFTNSRARQGVAVFWQEMLDFLLIDSDWYRDRQFLRTIVHELGHALNLAHTWLVGRADSTSFMNYPHRYPHGGSAVNRILNYWRDFDYTFDLEEIFHLQHGFYNEVVPGGRLEFMQWTPSSVFNDPTAGGTRSNISLEINETKKVYQYTEPVTVEVGVKNFSPNNIAIGRLSPAYGDIRYIIRKPSGTILQYKPPIYKCEMSKDELAGGQSKTHLTSLAVSADGFTFDTPGQYEITAAIPDPSSGTLVISRPVSVWIAYPDRTDEGVASRIFEREAGLFLYMAGGEHLEKGKQAMEEVTERYPEHPFAVHANLVLGLNKMAGQKRGVTGEIIQADLTGALPYLKKAMKPKMLGLSSEKRLKSTIDLCSRKGGKGTKGKKKK